jgi:hypothetical protein
MDWLPSAFFLSASCSRLAEVQLDLRTFGEQLVLFPDVVLHIRRAPDPRRTSEPGFALDLAMSSSGRADLRFGEGPGTSHVRDRPDKISFDLRMSGQRLRSAGRVRLLLGCRSIHPVLREEPTFPHI